MHQNLKYQAVFSRESNDSDYSTSGDVVNRTGKEVLRSLHLGSETYEK